MHSFLKKNLFFFCLLGGLLQLSVMSGNQLLRLIDTHKIPAESEYVILGNSRPQFALDDSRIRDVTNFSRGGEPYFYTRFKARRLVEENDHIKAVFLQYNWDDIGDERNEWIWSRNHLQINYRRYCFAMQMHDYNVLLEHNPFDFLNIHLFQTFPFQVKQIFLLNPEERRREYGRFYSVEGSGLEPEPGVETPEADSIEGIPEIENRHLRYLTEILETFRKHNITVYLMRAPVHRTMKRNVSPDELLNLLGEEWAHLEFLDFRDYPLADTEFANAGHLNFTGAGEFSAFFDELIRNGLLEKKDKAAFLKQEIARRKAERMTRGEL